MNVSDQHLDAAARLVEEPPGGEHLPPASEGYLRAVSRLEGTFEGSLRGRGVELLADGRLRSMPALGLSPMEARQHAYELLVAADVIEARG